MVRMCQLVSLNVCMNDFSTMPYSMYILICRVATKEYCTELNSQQASADKPDGREHCISEDLFAVHDFEIKIDLDVPSGKIKETARCQNMELSLVDGDLCK